MTPKEKAEEIVEKLLDNTYDFEVQCGLYCQGGSYDRGGLVKSCALILVSEILNILFQHHEIDYWKEVKQELEK